MDLFDWPSIIRRLRDEGLTQGQIGERTGWNREQVAQYLMPLNSIADVSHPCKPYGKRYGKPPVYHMAGTL